MRDGITYACLLVFSFVAAIATQYGWRPPFALAWDAPAQLVVMIGCGLLGGLSAYGLADLVPQTKIPKYVRFMLVSAAMIMTFGAFTGIANLSSHSTPQEAIWEIARGAGFGAVGGIVIGLIAATDPDAKKTTEPHDIRHARLTMALGVLGIISVVLLAIPRPTDQPKLTWLETYERNGARLDLGIGSSFLGRFGSLRICVGEKVNSVVLTDDEWRKVQNLFAKAAQSQSSEWRVVGSIDDHAPGDSTHLTISSGSGVLLEANSPHGDTVAFVLPAADLASLQDAAEEVAAALRTD